MDIGDDGTLPNFNSCTRHGPLPLVLCGKYSDQVRFALEHVREEIDLNTESVGFLKPLGGVWFKTLRAALSAKNLAHVDLTRLENWPQGPENIALSTMHSAKGLEFDHVIILGLNSNVTPHGADPQDSNLNNLRRLLAMAITRARKSVIIGYKPTEASEPIKYFDPSTHESHTL